MSVLYEEATGSKKRTPQVTSIEYSLVHLLIHFSHAVIIHNESSVENHFNFHLAAISMAIA